MPYRQRMVNSESKCILNLLSCEQQNIIALSSVLCVFCCLWIATVLWVTMMKSILLCSINTGDLSRL
jgi:hypothetical protein